MPPSCSIARITGPIPRPWAAPSSGVHISAGTGVRTLVPAGSLDQARSHDRNPAARTTTSSGSARARELKFWVVNNAFIDQREGMVRDSRAAVQDRPEWDLPGPPEVCPMRSVQLQYCILQAGYSSTAKRQLDEASQSGKGKGQVDPGHVEVHPDKIDKAMSER